MTIRFDDSLPRLVDIIEQTLGAEAVQAGVVVRDISGRLAFYTNHPLTYDTTTRISQQILDQLGPYARTDRVIAGTNEFGVQELLDDSSSLNIKVREFTVRVLDRRLVGADWLRHIVPSRTAEPRFVFASLKGGVGRSTALSVCAAHVAAQGRRVLAIDMDLEAPGLGPMLLDRATTPKFGLLDALVEDGLGGLDDEFIRDMVGPSPLADQRGRIDVLPVWGQRSLDHPADVLSKLARAYAEDNRPDGGVATLLDQIVKLISEVAPPGEYDAIFLDARAGLHESTAAAILGLDAEVYLFGLNEPQTFAAYPALLSHLARLGPQGETADVDWVSRLTMIQARALNSAKEAASFADKSKELFQRSGLWEPKDISKPVSELPTGSFEDLVWDDTIDDAEVLPDDHQPMCLSIFEDTTYRSFDPLRYPDLVSNQMDNITFAEILGAVEEKISSRENTLP